MALHKDLTGANLHEPKGVAAANANRVYVSDGAGSGSWSQVTTSVLAQTANGFGAALVHIQHKVADGTNLGAFASSWNTRVLNTTVTNEVSGASLASNQVTLPAGTYYASAEAICNANTGTNILRLYDATNATDLGHGIIVQTNTNSTDVATVSQRFTLAGAAAIEVQHFCSVANLSGGSFGTLGVGFFRFVDVKFWKIG